MSKSEVNLIQAFTHSRSTSPTSSPTSKSNVQSPTSKVKVQRRNSSVRAKKPSRMRHRMRRPRSGRLRASKAARKDSRLPPAKRRRRSGRLRACKATRMDSRLSPAKCRRNRSVRIDLFEAILSALLLHLLFTSVSQLFVHPKKKNTSERPTAKGLSTQVYATRRDKTTYCTYVSDVTFSA